MNQAARSRALDRLLPVIALAALGLTLAAVLSNAGSTLGYDFQAYVAAGHRVLDGRPLYDRSAGVAGPFAVYLYPPPFALASVPLALLPADLATWMWTGLLVGAFLAAVALFPVSTRVRWTTVVLAACCWPFLYAMKLGQVEPLLLLAFGAAWRWRDGPVSAGIAIGVGAIIKVQPALLLGWAVATRRWRLVGVGLITLALLAIPASVVLGVGVWQDYLALLGRVSDAVTTPHDFTPGAIAFQAGWTVGAAGALQLASTVATLLIVGVAWVVADPEPSLIATIVATQLLSPVLWDHYAAILLLPVAFLLERGQWWAAAIPLAFWLPAPAYPVLFWICLVVPLLVARTRPAIQPRLALPRAS